MMTKFEQLQADRAARETYTSAHKPPSAYVGMAHPEHAIRPAGADGRPMLRPKRDARPFSFPVRTR